MQSMDVDAISVHSATEKEAILWEAWVPLGWPVVMRRGAQLTAELLGASGTECEEGYAVTHVRVRIWHWQPRESAQAGFLHRVLTRLRGAL